MVGSISQLDGSQKGRKERKNLSIVSAIRGYSSSQLQRISVRTKKVFW